MATTTELLTAEQYFLLPDSGAPTELVQGHVIMMMNPGARHGYVCVNIVFELRDFLRSHDLGQVFSNDSGVVTQRGPDTVRGPDVAFFSYERMKKGEIPTGYPKAMPELVFEVKSPSDRWQEIHRKIGEYLTAGVQTVCIVDPETETVDTFDADKRQATFRIDDTLTLDVLPGFAVPVRKLFHA